MIDHGGREDTKRICRMSAARRAASKFKLRAIPFGNLVMLKDRPFYPSTVDLLLNIVVERQSLSDYDVFMKL